MTSPSPEQRRAARERPSGRRPVMYQTWSDLLLLHWRWEVDLHDASGTPGVWLFPLDANRRPDVRIARGWYGPPSVDARMTARRDARTGEIEYRSVRRDDPDKLLGLNGFDVPGRPADHALSATR